MRIKRPGREANHSPPFDAEVKMVEVKFHSRMRLQGVVFIQLNAEIILSYFTLFHLFPPFFPSVPFPCIWTSFTKQTRPPGFGVIHSALPVLGYQRLHVNLSIYFFSYGATAPIGASAYLYETLRFTSVYLILDIR
jgi:hypothetical protein